MGSGSSTARNKNQPPIPQARGQPAIASQPISQPASQPIIQPISQPASRSASKPASKPASTSASKPASTSASKPASGQRVADQTTTSQGQTGQPTTGKSVTDQPANGQTATGQSQTGKTATGQQVGGQTANRITGDSPAKATGQENTDSGELDPVKQDSNASSSQPAQQPPKGTSDEPTGQPQATGDVDATPPEKGNSSKSDEILSKCVKFLEVATKTGGQPASCSPDDAAAFVPNSEDREALRSEFLKSLERLRKTKTHTDDASMEDLLNVCNMSNLTDPETADELVEKGFPDLFVKIWNAVYHEDIYTSKELWKQFVVYTLIKQACINFTHVSRKLCAAMGSADRGIVALVANVLQHPLMTVEALKNDTVKQAIWYTPRETLKKAIRVLANIIRGDIDSKPVFRQADVMPQLKALILGCRFLIMRAKALFCLVYLLNEDENEALNATDDNIDFVLKVLGKCLDEKGHYSKHYTFSAEVVVDGIVHLALNDANKVKLVEKGVIDLLIKMLKTDSVVEKRIAARAVWKLAFHEDNKKKFKENTVLIKVLKELYSSESDPKIIEACKTVLWMLDVNIETTESNSGGNRPRTAKSRDKTAENSHQTFASAPDGAEKKDDDRDVVSLNEDFDDEEPHVMISYQWGVQQQMIKIKELLKAAGYNVWMDVDNMGDSTLESMAAAVERSAVVLVCFTEKYKQSTSCRTEAEYTYKLQRPIIPLRLQSDYDPDGWLGIMIGAKLYVDLSRPNYLEDDFVKLKQQLGGRGRLAKEGLNSTLKSTQQDPLNTTGSKNDSLAIQRGAPSRRSIANQDRHIDAKTVTTWTNDQVNAWLAKHGLAGLKNRFDGYSGQRLLGLKQISGDAPDFFYSELRKELGFKSLLEIVTFKQALDEII